MDYQYPLELNRYVYAAANPVLWRDPSGYQAAQEYTGIIREDEKVAGANIIWDVEFAPTGVSLVGKVLRVGAVGAILAPYFEMLLCALAPDACREWHGGGSSPDSGHPPDAGQPPTGNAEPGNDTSVPPASAGGSDGGGDDGEPPDGQNIPPGFTRSEWEAFKRQAIEFLRNSGLAGLNGELEVHGSMNPQRDLDMIYRVNPQIFEMLVADYYANVSNPPQQHITWMNQGRMTYSVLGSVSWGRFNDATGIFYTRFYDQWLNNFSNNYPRYQFSLVRAGSSFDNGPFIHIYP